MNTGTSLGSLARANTLSVASPGTGYSAEPHTSSEAIMLQEPPVCVAIAEAAWVRAPLPFQPLVVYPTEQSAAQYLSSPPINEESSNIVEEGLHDRSSSFAGEAVLDSQVKASVIQCASEWPYLQRHLDVRPRRFRPIDNEDDECLAPTALASALIFLFACHAECIIDDFLFHQTSCAWPVESRRGFIPFKTKPRLSSAIAALNRHLNRVTTTATSRNHLHWPISID